MTVRRTVTASVLTTALAGATLAGTGAFAAPSTASAPKPTIVLVHGAFADASSWNVVVRNLQAQGYPVVAPANPLRGLVGDSAYLASAIKGIAGPIVLVGHSYGGELITNAAADDPRVKALVYIAAVAPDQGESANDILNRYPTSKLPAALAPLSYPLADGSTGTGTDLYIKPDKFKEAFAADVSDATAAMMAATQRPVDATSLAAASPNAAWKTIPSWYLVAAADNAIPADAQRFMAARASIPRHTREVAASHAVAVSRPDAVTSIVVEAARSTAR